jgi:hypothetical protein
MHMICIVHVYVFQPQIHTIHTHMHNIAHAGSLMTLSDKVPRAQTITFTSTTPGCEDAADDFLTRGQTRVQVRL